MRSFLNQIEQQTKFNFNVVALENVIIIIRKSNRNPRPAASHTAERWKETNQKLSIENADANATFRF